MNTKLNIGRITGGLLLIVFALGVIIFQVLQGPVLFSDDFLTTAVQHENQIIGSVLLSMLSGVISIVIAIVLLPIFKPYNSYLAYLYLTFCILTFIAIMLDNLSVVSILELSKTNASLETAQHPAGLSNLVYQKHWWTHYFYLLLSCLPVFVFYYGMYISRLLPRVLAIFGIVAVVVMFTEEVLAFYGNGFGMNMLLPIGLIQLVVPIWLIIKGFKQEVVTD